MDLGICLLSVVPMRKEPSHRSEMVSQLLFGEYAELSEEKDHFLKIKSRCDQYEGWVQISQLERISPMEFKEISDLTCSYTSDVLRNGQLLKIAYGTPLHDLNNSSLVIAGNEIRHLVSPENVWNSMERKFTRDNLAAVYDKYLNTPYLWGGRSVFGIDCSGFVQQVFKMFGKKLLRDAYLQATQGEAVAHLEEAKPGDLAFFQNENGKIVHVGIILSEGQIVHAAGQVRVDTFDEMGIVNKSSGKRTHQLHSMRRYF